MKNHRNARIIRPVTAVTCVLALASCSHSERPGHDRSAHASSSALPAVPSASRAFASASSAARQQLAKAPASSSSSVVKTPHSHLLGDKKIYSLAIETYIRAVPSKGGRALGYFRVGESLRRSDEPVGHNGCKKGWYAVEPRGFVCDGSRSTVNPEARMLDFARPPHRGSPEPYVFAKVKGRVPYYYARLPATKDIRRMEGAAAIGRIKQAWVRPDPNLSVLGDAMPTPERLLRGERVPRPPGTEPRLRFKFHTGRAEPGTRVALLGWFENEHRRYGISSQLDLIALDGVRIIKTPTFHGVALEEGETLPVGFVWSRAAKARRLDESGKVVEQVALTYRQALKLSGKTKKIKGGELLETRDGLWVSRRLLHVVEPRTRVPKFVKKDTLRWLDISIRHQTLVAYRGRTPVYVTLVSTGRGMLGDPHTTHATPRGLFAVFSKHVSTKMSGDVLGAEYRIDEVPYVQYFHKGYALHGAFWHNNFGRVQSHGCVNLAPTDAAWVFAFTGPEVPTGWHGAFVRRGGTPVFIHR